MANGKRVRLERRIVVLDESGHGTCAEAIAKRVIYHGPYRLTLCAHTESDIRVTVLPAADKDTRDELYEIIRDTIGKMQRSLGAER